MHIVIKHSQKANLATTIEQNVLLLVCLAPLCIPFGLVRNLGLQAIIIMLSGLLAWVAVGVRYRSAGTRLPAIIMVLLGLYIATCVTSLLANFSAKNAFGAPLLRLGSIELLASVGIGLALRHCKDRTLSRSVYAAICSIAIVSLPFTLIQSHRLGRVGGILYQPDWLALTLAVGLLLGIGLWQQQKQKQWRSLLAFMQLYLTVVLFLTQTRAVIVLLLLIVGCQLVIARIALVQKLALALGIIILSGILVRLTVPITTGRLVDSQFAGQSITYRLDLQLFAARHLTDRPLTGYGAASIDTPLACSHITKPSLLQTCNKGYYFNSAHNIYLDRALGLGWLGGIALIALTASILWKARKVSTAYQRQFWFAACLIVAYCLTNVSNLTIDVLLWILLLRLPLGETD